MYYEPTMVKWLYTSLMLQTGPNRLQCIPLDGALNVNNFRTRKRATLMSDRNRKRGMPGTEKSTARLA